MQTRLIGTLDRRSRAPGRRLGARAGAVLAAWLLALPVSVASAPDAQAAPIPPAPGHRLVPRYEGSPAAADPLPADQAPPQHPYLAPNGRAGMHGDGASSDTHPFPGPLGNRPTVTSEKMAALGGECATVTFDRDGRLLTVCGTFQGFRLKLLDPGTLATLAEYKLPQRPSTVEAITRLDFSKIFKDTSGGAYFYLDNEDRVVLADSRQHVLRLSHTRAADGSWHFTVDNDWDLTPYVPHDCVGWTNLHPRGECDPVTSVQPDWDGRIWWVTRKGRIGTIAPDSGAVRTVRLPGEEIQNSFSAARDGVSLVSDHALYSLRADADGTPRIQWRRAYDRGTGGKPGSVNQGSGTTPTLLGDAAHPYVAITDNADDRMHVLVYRRTGPHAGRLLCTVPVFGSGASTTDNSLIGYGNSLVVENNYGYENVTSLLFGKSVVGGITRVDIRPDGSGCDTVWESTERAPSSVAKLSTANGLLYFYTKEPNRLGIDAWYLTAVDFRTGRTRFKRLTGTGPLYDNDWAPITLGPDGTAYAGVFNGLVAVRDTAPPS
ncbi:hypothetical protein [Streptomyces chattanoogensis]|uniref:Uncharacterized protein n=1 Tax=Streptomyces chattanoogensis TaxID=66876 RepID=A0A0N1JYW9_9ACTN|nr:hypothetical protein [Streptomyces chattanoogensis]KPC64838.1 hypothetical protein ADL29_09405 [Streptomyces chattanoogensis]